MVDNHPLRFSKGCFPIFTDSEDPEMMIILILLMKLALARHAVIKDAVLALKQAS